MCSYSHRHQTSPDRRVTSRSEPIPDMTQFTLSLYRCIYLTGAQVMQVREWTKTERELDSDDSKLQERKRGSVMV